MSTFQWDLVEDDNVAVRSFDSVIPGSSSCSGSPMHTSLMRWPCDEKHLEAKAIWRVVRNKLNLPVNGNDHDRFNGYSDLSNHENAFWNEINAFGTSAKTPEVNCDGENYNSIVVKVEVCKSANEEETDSDNNSVLSSKKTEEAKGQSRDVSVAFPSDETEIEKEIESLHEMSAAHKFETKNSISSDNLLVDSGKGKLRPSLSVELKPNPNCNDAVDVIVPFSPFETKGESACKLTIDIRDNEGIELNRDRPHSPDAGVISAISLALSDIGLSDETIQNICLRMQLTNLSSSLIQGDELLEESFINAYIRNCVSLENEEFEAGLLKTPVCTPSSVKRSQTVNLDFFSNKEECAFCSLERGVINLETIRRLEKGSKLPCSRCSQ